AEATPTDQVGRAVPRKVDTPQARTTFARSSPLVSLTPRRVTAPALCLSDERPSAGVFCAPLGTQIRLTDYLCRAGWAICRPLTGASDGATLNLLHHFAITSPFAPRRM